MQLRPDDLELLKEVVECLGLAGWGDNPQRRSAAKRQFKELIERLETIE